MAALAVAAASLVRGLRARCLALMPTWLGAPPRTSPTATETSLGESWVTATHHYTRLAAAGGNGPWGRRPASGPLRIDLKKPLIGLIRGLASHLPCQVHENGADRGGSVAPDNSRGESAAFP